MARQHPDCLVCGSSIEIGTAVACGLCRTPHHADCWDYLGRCGVFGCGGIAHIPFQPQAPDSGLPVIIDESTSPPMIPRIHGWIRRFLSRARDMPVPVSAGLLGSVAVLGCFAGSQLALGLALGAGFYQFTGMVLAAGVLHGMASPFLASLQHRFPRESLVAGLAASGGMVALLNLVRPHGALEMLMVAATMASFLTFATSTGEWLFGRYTRAGQKLGLLALPARIGATWLAFVGSCAAISWLFTGSLSLQALFQILLWSLMTVAVATPSLEVGRERYHKHLIALAEAPQD